MKRDNRRGRPRSFNEQDVLEASMATFWKYGFTATNYAVLEQATGLRRQSIIYAFGDKRALFLKSLSLYFSTRVSEVVTILGRGGSDLENIRSVFDAWLTFAEDKNKRGCLIVNTAGQFDASDKEVSSIVNKAVGALRDAFTAAFTSAQRSGEVSDTIAARDLARLTVAAGNGALLHVHSDENTENIMHVLNSLIKICRHDDSPYSV